MRSPGTFSHACQQLLLDACGNVNVVFVEFIYNYGRIFCANDLCMFQIVKLRNKSYALPFPTTTLTP